MFPKWDAKQVVIRSHKMREERRGEKRRLGGMGGEGRKRREERTALSLHFQAVGHRMLKQTESP